MILGEVGSSEKISLDYARAERIGQNWIMKFVNSPNSTYHSFPSTLYYISSSDKFTDLCSEYPFRKFFSSLVSKLEAILNGAVLRSTLTWSPFWSLTLH